MNIFENIGYATVGIISYWILKHLALAMIRIYKIRRVFKDAGFPVKFFYPDALFDFGEVKLCSSSLICWYGTRIEQEHNHFHPTLGHFLVPLERAFNVEGRNTYLAEVGDKYFFFERLQGEQHLIVEGELVIYQHHLLAVYTNSDDYKDMWHLEKALNEYSVSECMDIIVHAKPMNFNADKLATFHHKALGIDLEMVFIEGY